MSEARAHSVLGNEGTRVRRRLHRGALSLIDISASTMANIGPAYSFYFGFAGSCSRPASRAPLMIIAAIIAIALLGNTLAQFSRAHP